MSPRLSLVAFLIGSLMLAVVGMSLEAGAKSDLRLVELQYASDRMKELEPMIQSLREDLWNESARADLAEGQLTKCKVYR